MVTTHHYSLPGRSDTWLITHHYSLPARSLLQISLFYQVGAIHGLLQTTAVTR